MRRKVKSVHKVPADAKYQSESVARFINAIMWDGKKSVARTMVYGAFDIIKGKDEVIAVQATRIERESTDKVSWKRAADLWKKRAEEAGWSNDVVIDINPREAAHG